MHKFLMAALWLFSLNVFAGEVSLLGRVFYTSPAYFSTMQADLRIDYRNEAVRYPSHRVFLRYGFSYLWTSSGKSTGDLDWHREKEVELYPFSPSDWRADLREEVASRGSYTIKNFHFVIIVRDTEGNEVIVDNGTEGVNWSFYTAKDIYKRTHLGLTDIPFSVSNLDK